VSRHSAEYGKLGVREITLLLTACSVVHLEKLTVVQMVKKTFGLYRPINSLTKFWLVLNSINPRKV
jgi:hypothetical protein